LHFYDLSAYLSMCDDFFPCWDELYISFVAGTLKHYFIYIMSRARVLGTAAPHVADKPDHYDSQHCNSPLGYNSNTTTVCCLKTFRLHAYFSFFLFAKP
jgi:hypothetical protein